MATFTFRRESWLHDAVYVRAKPFGFQVTQHGITDSCHTSFQFLYIFTYNFRFHYPRVGETFPVRCVFCGL
jgi:hypothetical protein